MRGLTAIRGTPALLSLALALAALLPVAARAQNPVACDFDIPDNRGLNVTGKTIHLVGRAGASSDRGSFYITNGNTPAGDDDGDGYAPACDFHNLFVSLRGTLVNQANDALAIPGQNIVISNLNARLLSGEVEQVDVQVEIPNETQAGTYRGFITIRDDSIRAVPNAEREILNLDNIFVEVVVLPDHGFAIVQPDQPLPLDSLLIGARAGRRGEGVFRIANVGNSPLQDVRLTASDLRSESAVGLTIPAANVQITPATYSALAVGDTQRVTVSVLVPRGILGGRYRGTIFVQGQDATPVQVPLIVTVTSSRGILFENNPVRTVNGDIGRISFNGDPGTPYKLAIFDMMGLLVYTADGTVYAGAGATPGTPGPDADFAVSLSWPLANGRGEAVASGVYLVVVESIVAGERQLARDKLIVIR